MFDTANVLGWCSAGLGLFGKPYLKFVVGFNATAFSSQLWRG